MQIIISLVLIFSLNIYAKEKKELSTNTNKVMTDYLYKQYLNDILMQTNRFNSSYDKKEIAKFYSFLNVDASIYPDKLPSAIIKEGILQIPEIGFTQTPTQYYNNRFSLNGEEVPLNCRFKEQCVFQLLEFLREKSKKKTVLHSITDFLMSSAHAKKRTPLYDTIMKNEVVFVAGLAQLELSASFNGLKEQEKFCVLCGTRETNLQNLTAIQNRMTYLIEGVCHNNADNYLNRMSSKYTEWEIKHSDENAPLNKLIKYTTEPNSTVQSNNLKIYKKYLNIGLETFTGIEFRSINCNEFYGRAVSAPEGYDENKRSDTLSNYELAVYQYVQLKEVMGVSYPKTVQAKAKVLALEEELQDSGVNKYYLSKKKFCDSIKVLGSCLNDQYLKYQAWSSDIYDSEVRKFIDKTRSDLKKKMKAYGIKE